MAGLGLTAILTHVAGVNAWWLLPLVAFAALGWSLHRATAPQVNRRSEVRRAHALATARRRNPLCAEEADRERRFPWRRPRRFPVTR